MHIDYVVETQNTIVEHNKATQEYLDRTRKMRDRLVQTRDKIEAEIAALEMLEASLTKVGEVGKATAHVFQNAGTETETEEHDDAPAATELERKVIEGLTFDDLDPESKTASAN